MRHKLHTVIIVGLWIVAAAGAILTPLMPDNRFYNRLWMLALAVAITVTLGRIANRAHGNTANVTRSEVRRLGNIVETTAIVRESKHAKPKSAQSDSGIVSLLIDGMPVGVKVEPGTPINVAAVEAALREVRESSVS